MCIFTFGYDFSSWSSDRQHKVNGSWLNLISLDEQAWLRNSHKFSGLLVTSLGVAAFVLPSGYTLVLRDTEFHIFSDQPWHLSVRSKIYQQKNRITGVMETLIWSPEGSLIEENTVKRKTKLLQMQINDGFLIPSHPWWLYQGNSADTFSSNIGTCSVAPRTA